MRVAVIKLAPNSFVIAGVGVVGRHMSDKGTSFVDVFTNLLQTGSRQDVYDGVGTVVVDILNDDRHLPIGTHTAITNSQRKGSKKDAKTFMVSVSLLFASFSLNSETPFYVNYIGQPLCRY